MRTSSRTALSAAAQTIFPEAVQRQQLSRREGDAPAKDNTIRVDTDRLDQVLNLSGEIGLTKNRLTHLRTDILHGTRQCRHAQIAG